MYRYPNLPFYESFGAIPSSYLISLSYEEQILWLCRQIQALKEGTPNFNYDLLENKPSINGIPLQGNLTKEQLGLTNDYNALVNKPTINGTQVSGNKTLLDYGIQAKLTAGTGISIVGNTISATGGGGGGGGSSDYNDLSNQPQINSVTLVGNSTARDLGLQDRTIENISGLTYGTFYTYGAVTEGDFVPFPYESILHSNEDSARKLIYCYAGTSLEIDGAVDIIKFDKNNIVSYLYSTGGDYDSATYFNASTEGYVCLSFHLVADHPPKIKLILTGDHLKGEQLAQDKQININRTNIESIVNEQCGITEIELDDGYAYEDNAQQILTRVQKANAKSFVFNLDQKMIYSKIKVKGWARNEYMFYFADENSRVFEISNSNITFDNLTDYYLNIPEGTHYIAVNFYNTDEHDCELQVQYIDGTINFYSREAIILNSDGTFNVEDTQVNNIPSGWYDTKVPIYKGSAIPQNIIYFNEMVYYDSTTKIFYGALKSYHYFAGAWSVQENVILDTSIRNNPNTIPTTKAVYDAFQTFHPTGDVFYTTIDEDITLNADGTSSYNFVNGKYYYLTDGHKITYTGYNNSTETEWNFTNSIFYYDETTTSQVVSISIKRTGVNHDPEVIIEYDLCWNNGLGYWFIEDTNPYYSYVQNYNSLSSVYTRNSIPSSGQNNDVPTINAVRNYVSQNVANYSTTEHVVGTWIDGKPLYEKVITDVIPTYDGTNPNGASSNFTIDSNTEFALIENATFLYGTSPFAKRPLPYTEYTYDSVDEALINRCIQIRINTSGELTITSFNTNFNAKTFYAVVRYTKSTDPTP